MTKEKKKMAESLSMEEPLSEGKRGGTIDRKKNVIMAFFILLGYFLTYLLGRVLYTKPGDYTFHQWLWGSWHQLDYLFGWLLNQKLYWFIAAVSVIPALLGKYRFGWWVWFGCSTGLLLGEPLGETPIDNYNHYGWVIWVMFVFISFIAGILLERLYKKHGTYRHRSILACATAALIAYGWVILDTLLTIQSYTPPY